MLTNKIVRNNKKLLLIQEEGFLQVLDDFLKINNLYLNPIEINKSYSQLKSIYENISNERKKLIQLKIEFKK
ncbi:MAG: hypothetical protein KC589_08000 [Nanoarchaeota archaeon]|nr:hypothetical protein [Nanoarchaeota archaeon]